MSALQLRSGLIAALSLLIVPSFAIAQQASASKTSDATESRSATLATELTQLLSSQKLDSIATTDADTYVGALYIPGSQLLVVRANAAPALKDRMSYLLHHKMYKEAYGDLNSASDANTRLLVSDLGADGLRFKRDKDQPFDMVSIGGRSVAFDGKWGGKNGISRDEYTKSYESTDQQYAQMLTALIAALKKSS